MKEIERRFLVNETPESVRIGDGTSIIQGYLSAEGDKEVRIRQAGKKYVLTSKKGSGLQREENEVSISSKQFDILWPASAGRQLQKDRHVVGLRNGFRAELDIYQGELTGLQIVEVEFPDVEEAERFEIPGWFGPEVTNDLQFSNRALAVYSPGSFPENLQKALLEARHSVGSIPVIQLNGIDHLVVISTRNNQRWIFPKGNPEAGVADKTLAAQEALEEAGVEGELFGTPIPVHYWKGYVHYIIEYYPMLVSTLYTRWEEEEIRQRRVCTEDEAAKLLNDSGFILAMQSSIKKLHSG